MIILNFIWGEFFNDNCNVPTLVLELFNIHERIAQHTTHQNGMSAWENRGDHTVIHIALFPIIQAYTVYQHFRRRVARKGTHE